MTRNSKPKPMPNLWFWMLYMFNESDEISAFELLQKLKERPLDIGRIGTFTLYRALRSLEEQGWISESGDRYSPDGEYYRYYYLSWQGRGKLKAERELRDRAGR